MRRQSVDQIDVWVGGLAEDAVPGAHVGELTFSVLKQQFEALRDGDRFWYERSLQADELAAIRATRLSDIIRRNTTIGDEISDDVPRLRRYAGTDSPPPMRRGWIGFSGMGRHTGDDGGHQAWSVVWLHAPVTCCSKLW